MLRKLTLILMILLVVACGGGESEPEVEVETAVEVTYELDEATGLPFNPPIDAVPDSEFIIEGEISAVTLIPQDKPLFKIVPSNVDGDLAFQVNAQPVADIFVEDGTQLKPHEIQAGLRARATLHRADAGGLGGQFVFSSDDLMLLLDEE